MDHSQNYLNLSKPRREFLEKILVNNSGARLPGKSFAKLRFEAPSICSFEPIFIDKLTNQLMLDNLIHTNSASFIFMFVNYYILISFLLCNFFICLMPVVETEYFR